MKPIAVLSRPTGRLGKLSVVVIIAIAVVAAGGTFAFVKMRSKSEAAETDATGEVTEEAAAEENLGPEETVDLGEFLVNIADDGGAMRYLKTQISLVVQAREHEEAGGGHGGGGKDGPQLPPAEHRIARDAVVSALCSQKFETLREDEGWSDLRDLLRSALTERLESFQVTEVLITDLVMQ